MNGHSHFELPAECTAAVVRDEGPNCWVEILKVPLPEIGPDEVLIKLNVTGLCMSDLHYMLNDLGVGPMSSRDVRCAGHEGAGVIVKVGERVKTLKVGMRAGYKPILDICHVCDVCKRGDDAYCLKRVLPGYHCDGSYKEYCVSPERYTTIIPDGVSDYIAGPIMCSTSTMYASLREANLEPGSWAVFLGGGGGVGSQGLQLAVEMGLRPIVVDTGSDKANLSKAIGAEYFFDFRQVDPIAEVLRVTEGGAHGVFVLAPPSYPSAIRYLGDRIGGQVMCIGVPSSKNHLIDLDPIQLINKKQAIKGTCVAGLADVDKALRFAQRGKIKLEPKVVGLSRWNEAIQQLKRSEVAGRIVVDFRIP